MKRRNLCKTKKLISIIISASMALSPGITAMAESSEDVVGFEVSATEGKTESKTEENATASLEGSGNATGVDAEAKDNSSATATIEKDVTATATSDKWDRATGVNADAKNDSTTNVSVGNDVKATATSDTSGYSVGVDAKSSDKSATTVSVANDVSVTSSTGSTGVSASASNDSKTEVDIGKDLTVSSGGYSTTTGVKTNAYSSGSSSSTDDDNSSVSVKIGGEVSVTAKTNDNDWSVSATGVNVDVSKNTKSEVSIENDLTVTSDGSAKGIETWTYDDSSSNVTVGGDINVDMNVVSTGGYDSKSAYGIYAQDYGDSSSNFSVGGDLNVIGTTNYVNWYLSSTGISAYTGTENSSINVTIGGDLNVSGADYATAVSGQGEGALSVDIGGNIIQNGEHGAAVDLKDYGADTATITVKVAENITATGDAISIMKASDKSTIDLVVGGTVSGGEHSLVLVNPSSSGPSETTKSSTENLNITVWKIEPAKDTGNLIEDAKWTVSESSKNYEYTRNEAAEKSINYIVKVDPVATSTGGALAVSGTTEIHGYQTAHEGDKVYLEVTVPSGYTVDSFYNVEGAADCKVISSGGKYYLEVPRGGGVFVGVNLKRVSSSGSSDSSSSDNDDDWTVGQAQKVTTGVFSPTAFAGLTFQAIGVDGTPLILNVLDVLTPLEPVSAFNNFTLGRPTYGLNNVLGAAVVDFNDLLATTLGDIVNIPVAANVTAGYNYTVYFSDGTSTTVQCTTDGILTIPFNKNTKGLTYMIYGAQSNPLMGLPSIDAVEPIRQIGIGENAFKSADLNFGFESPTGLKQIGYDTFAGSTELHPQLIGNDGQR
ncbi:MAG: hypothetical protein E7232_14810 [Lachnospiraceae bacterium]|nr:hypothetical protein [Lachnospiraceae bacterium]